MCAERVAFVTGGMDGLGAAISRRLHEAGMTVAVSHTGRLDPKHLITHRFSLDDVERAYDTFGRAAQTQAQKVIIEVG
ncbi:alcohol dehydrogenase [Burkholderia lata]|uniref:Alcohol dehydrogenase n=1 Tax=Burkholderia lata (strain ATCC 17760 / DSM 23089 / LMG 22485 / NCIMB 9086 / R18194 / 383) TaxID=482957 RepID=A0A6P2KAU0_BURL3|nr:alcohol dehydrogenase [Burkholderia lata]